MRFKRFNIRPTKIARTVRRVKNAERAIQKEREEVPLFPELVRFKNADERLNHLDEVQIAYWQKIRDCDARMWRKFRRRLYGLPETDCQKFLDYWNAHVMIPGEACYASDTLTNFFNREDWRQEDIAAIQKGGAK